MRTKMIISLMTVFLTFLKGVNAQVQWGVRGGINFSDIVQVKNDKAVNTRARTGYHAGATVDIPVLEKLYIQPALLFSAKGVNNYDAVEIDINAYYLEVPVTFIYKPSLGTGKILLGAGPYVGYGLGGKWQRPADYYDVDRLVAIDGPLQFVNDTKAADYYYITPGGPYTYGKPVDFGANILAGYELTRHLSAQLNGQLGILNIAPRVDGSKTNDKLHNYNFGLSVGYKF